MSSTESLSIEHGDPLVDRSLEAFAGAHDRDTLLEGHRIAGSVPQLSELNIQSVDGAFVNHRGRLPTTIMVNIASVLEKTDEQLLPSVYKYVACSFNAAPEQLGYITSSRAVCQALASALGGYLGHKYDRSKIIALGCFIWGLMTFMFSFTSSVGWGAFTWAWNGIGLSFVIPNTQSLIADYYVDADRGKAFGTLYTTGALGGMLGTAFATNIAGYTIMGTDGWRWGFRVVAVVSASIGVAALAFSRDPLYYQADGSKRLVKPHGDDAPPWKEFLQVVRVPTFQVIILQGILGSTPWNALVFMTLYLQLLGFSNFHASLILTFFLAGAALGGVVGGFVGDWAAARSRLHGRIYACQFSVFMGIPFSLLVMKGLPRHGSGGAAALYAVIMFCFGLAHVWAAPACNNPVFAEIVPPKLRNLVYAFDRSFEGAIAALGAPLVGVVATSLFGFPADSPSYECVNGYPEDRGGDIAAKAAKATALGNAMLVCMIVPWALCLLIYSALHWTYPRDRAKVQQSAAPATGGQAPDASGFALA